MSMPILRIRGEDGQMHEVLAIRGEKGQDGKDGVSPELDTIVQAVLAALPDGDEVSY